MNTSLKRRTLSRPDKGERISVFDLGRVRARNRNKAHSLLLEEFKKSGLTKADLAKMLGKRPEQITRWLGGPANLTLDSISDLIFALRGDFATIQVEDELSKAKSNYRYPEWLVCPVEGLHWKQVKVGGAEQEKLVEDVKTSTYSLMVSSRRADKEGEYGRYTTVDKQRNAEVI